MRRSSPMTCCLASTSGPTRRSRTSSGRPRRRCADIAPS
nr:MAG TPA: hypothetical protein [Caudoviricetes sp.]